MNYDINAYIGLKLKNRRNEMGITQQELGKTIGISFQQIQKYEKGINRINASNLYELSKVLKVPMSYFFDGFDAFVDNFTPKLSEFPDEFVHNDSFSSVETITLINYWYKITKLKVRRRMLDLIKSISANTEEDEEN